MLCEFQNIRKVIVGYSYPWIIYECLHFNVLLYVRKHIGMIACETKIILLKKGYETILMISRQEESFKDELSIFVTL
jgi:hypothetical protein